MKINVSDLKRLYIDEMKTDEDIALYFKCTKNAVYRARKRFGIMAFKRWERNNCEPTPRQIEVIYGSMLGDGSISNGIKNKKPCQSIFEVKHCDKQKDYVEWKYMELKSLCPTGTKKVKNGERIQWRIRTFHHPFFTRLRKLFYPKGVKIITKEILDNIGVLGLAVWYMDDGTLSKHGNHIKFCTCSFSERDNLILSQWLENRFLIKTEIKIYSGYRFLIVDLASRKRLIEIIKQAVIPCMKYKTIFREFHTWVNI
jgi:recombination protein RecA